MLSAAFLQRFVCCHGKATRSTAPIGGAHTAVTAHRPRKHVLVVEVEHRLMLEVP